MNDPTRSFSIYEDKEAEVRTILTTIYDALKQKGKRVPDDVSVIGIDDIMFSQYINPPLTTLGYNNEEFGAKTFKVLMKKMSGKEVETVKEYCYIVERSTVKKV